MNQVHLDLLASDGWRTYVSDDLLPWVLAHVDLGDDVLEIGPGPGLTTDVLRAGVPRLTAVELDQALADQLRERLAGTNVEVIAADATAAGLPDERFSAATCFTMLHHIPTAEQQDALFAEVHRMLRPGGVFVGSDATDSESLRSLHVDDVFNPVDPEALRRRLEHAGFAAPVEVEAAGDRVRFVARKAATA